MSSFTLTSTAVNTIDSDDSDFMRPGCIEMIGGKLYSFLQPIGQGSDGEVFLATEESSPQPLAVKIISKEGKAAEQVRRARREAELHKSLQRHPNILSLHDVAETQDELCLVTDYAANGDLFDLLYGTGDKDGYKDFSGLLEERLAKKIFAQTLLAVEHCHRHHIAHRDIKPENILLDHNMNVKLADFGLAFRFRPNGVVSTPVGSLVYAAPEVLNGTGYEGPEVDTWALGVLLFELVAGTYPFIVDDSEADTNSLDTQRQMCQRILKCNYSVPNYVDPEARILISKILQRSKRRITIAEIKLSPWIRDVIAELEPTTAAAWLESEEDSMDVHLTTSMNTGKENQRSSAADISLPSWNAQPTLSWSLGSVPARSGYDFGKNLNKGKKQKLKKQSNSGNLSKKPSGGVYPNEQLKRTNLLNPVPINKCLKSVEPMQFARSLTPVGNRSAAATVQTSCRTEVISSMEQPSSLGFSWPKWSLPDRPRTLSADCK